MISSRAKKKNVFYRNKQKLITFGSQAKEASNYFVMNNQLRKLGRFLMNRNKLSPPWFPLLSSLPYLFGGTKPTDHRAQGHVQVHF